MTECLLSQNFIVPSFPLSSLIYPLVCKEQQIKIFFVFYYDPLDNQHPKFYTIVLVVTHIFLQILYRIVIARAASTMLVSCVYNICFHQSYIALTLAIYDYHLNRLVAKPFRNVHSSRPKFS